MSQDVAMTVEPEEAVARSPKTSSERLLKLLMLFSDRSGPRSVDELARDLDVPNSTVYRYVKALSDVGLIVAVTPGFYILGPAIIVMDRQMRLSDPLLSIAAQSKWRIAKKLPSPGVILFCRLFRNSVMCVDSHEIGRVEFEVSYTRGKSVPIYHGAASKAILAYVSLRTLRARFEAEPDQFRGARLGPDWRSVKASLRKIRQERVIVTRGEVDRGLVGVASPILGPDQQIVGSLGYVIEEGAATPEVVEAIVAAIRVGAEKVQHKLAGFTSTP